MLELRAKDWTPDCDPGDAFMVSRNVFMPTTSAGYDRIYVSKGVYLMVTPNNLWVSALGGTLTSEESKTPLQAVESLMCRYANLVIQGVMSAEEDLAMLLKFLKSRSLPVLNLGGAQHAVQD
jgi:hypothetical protein